MRNDSLREARVKRAWTQQQLANKLEVGDTTVRFWEGGDRTPSPKMCSRLCDLFGMTAEELGLVQNETEPLPQEGT
jgi:DNA-binding XRE family transcriptional regulator